MTTYLQMIDQGNDWVFRSLNILLNIEFLVHRLLNGHYLKKNANLLNRHVGEIALIVGNGPSANTFLEKFSKSIRPDVSVFVINSVVRASWLSVLQPRYYIAIDPSYFEFGSEANKDFNATIDALPSATFLLGQKARLHYKNKLAHRKAYYVYARQILTRNKICVDPTANMTCCINVLAMCLQIALTMRFKTIFLVGFDFDFVTPDKVFTHCYDTNNPESLKSIRNSEIYRHLGQVSQHLDCLAELASLQASQILNLSGRSLIDSFPKCLAEDSSSFRSLIL